MKVAAVHPYLNAGVTRPCFLPTCCILASEDKPLKTASPSTTPSTRFRQSCIAAMFPTTSWYDSDKNSGSCVFLVSPHRSISRCALNSVTPSRPPSLLPRVGSKSTWVRTRSFACSTVSQTVVDGFRGDETAETVALRWRVLSVVIHQKMRPHHFAGRTRLQARIHVRRCSSASQSASDSVCHGAM